MSTARKDTHKLVDIAAVVFDMDGLMLDSERVSQDIWQQVTQDFGFNLPVNEYRRIIGTSAEQTSQVIQELLGPDAPVMAMHAEKRRRLEHHVRTTGIGHKPGLLELFNALEARGLPKAVATSTQRHMALLKLETAQILDRFQAVVGGDEVEQGKPAPDLFLRAAELLTIAPERCLALEDSINGARAAHAAGMRLIVIPDLLPPTPEVQRMAWRILPSLHDVAALIKSKWLST
jgi:HAD superfamily hydrolase (TIGR01509 family)